MICGRASLTVIKKCETEEHFISTSGNDISFPFKHGSLDFTVESRVSFKSKCFSFGLPETVYFLIFSSPVTPTPYKRAINIL